MSTVVVDSSALVALALGEPGHESVAALLREAPRLSMSAATYVECAIVLDSRLGPATRAKWDLLLDLYGISVIPLDAQQAHVARQAHQAFGRGSGSPARLNLGDCYSYALAATLVAPLLYVGDDFTHTDLVPALRR